MLFYDSNNNPSRRVGVLQVDALRVRLEEKEQFLTKKTKQLQDLTDEKSTLTGEIRDLKDMLDVKERKVNVLQKKVTEPSSPFNGCSARPKVLGIYSKNIFNP